MHDRKLLTVHEYHLAGCLAMCGAGLLLVFVVTAGSLFWMWRIKQPEIAPPGYCGDPGRGRNLISTYGCTSCHVVPRMTPRGMVGPSLEGIARRSYIAGRFPNHEIWMTTWLEHPQQIKPGTAMPDLRVGRRDALDMASYLATLR